MKLGMPTSIPIPRPVHDVLVWLIKGILEGFYAQHDTEGAHKNITATAADVSGTTMLGTLTAFRGGEYDTSAAVLTPTQITANTNDYDPPDWRYVRVVRLSFSAAWNLTGWKAPSVDDQKFYRLMLINISANAGTLTHQDAASTTRNQFFGPGSAAVALAANDSAVIWYDQTSGGWRITATI